MAFFVAELRSSLSQRMSCVAAASIAMFGASSVNVASATPSRYKAFCPNPIFLCLCTHKEVFKRSENLYSLGDKLIKRGKYFQAKKSLDLGMDAADSLYFIWTYHGDMIPPPDRHVLHEMDKGNFAPASRQSRELLRDRLQELRQHLKICAAAKP